MLQKNNTSFLYASSEEEKKIPICQFKVTFCVRSLSTERVLLCYLTFLCQTQQRKASSFEGKHLPSKMINVEVRVNQGPIPSERSAKSHEIVTSANSS